MLIHPVAAYLRKRGETIASLAARAGVQRASLSRVLGRRRHRLGVDSTLRLSRATGIAPMRLLMWRWPKIKK